jgi:hypothetical protein
MHVSASLTDVLMPWMFRWRVEMNGPASFISPCNADPSTFFLS